MATFNGTPVNDTFGGTADGDVYLLQQGGEDTAVGGLGDDGFYFGGALSAGDVADGGSGDNDQVALQGTYPALTLSAGNFVGIETLALLSQLDGRFATPPASASRYNITTVDANVAAGQNFTINANGMLDFESLTFDGSAETDGSFRIFGGRSTERLTGGALNDGFFFGEGRFNGSTDKVNGGGGSDNQLALRGQYTGANAVNFATDALTNVQTVVAISSQDPRFGASETPFTYELVFDRRIVGDILTVTGAGLAADERLIVNGASSVGSFRLIGGAGRDTFTGGFGVDFFFGGLGGDNFGTQAFASGGLTGDRFFYTQTDQSFGKVGGDTIDFIVNFRFGDIIDILDIDANEIATGNQDFLFIRNAIFSGRPGELRIEELAPQSFGVRNWLVEANTDSDLDAEFAIHVRTLTQPLTAADFIGLTS